jgi:acetyl-CoA synthetase
LGGWLNGVTLVWQEGAGFALPSLERFYRTIEKYRVNKVHLAPTVLRMLKAQGEEIISKFDLSSLELILSMGEPMSPDLWHWTVENIGKGKLYLNNAWAMTELGCCFAQSTAFIDPLKPGAIGQLDSPAWGCLLAVMDDEGNELPPETRGNVVVRKPFPGVARTLWKEHERYLNDYYHPIKGVWFCSDEGLIDKDGYMWILGRTDDVINVAGHRIETSEIESAIASCHEVESAAVIGVPDPVKEQVPVAFIKLKEGTEENNELRNEINKAVVKSVGKYAQLEEIIFVKQLPTTISGKIMRRVIRDIRIHGQVSGDVSTLEDAGSVELLQKAMKSRREKLGGE